ncbi:MULTISPECIES: tryptophan synthase subunit alpha [Paenibacillus]|uniref:Tryptophan synthase alpha chain n=1 Tax=Paenibacillus albilobatus TaxID=2716884 RepID=A0A919XFR7_9BACL|nr:MULTISPECIES: tryptophan synthase subunit alpha [Paenibacillus]GIO30884.1 tryptophan synthase alpha chain [Paenibacillus albilobatus]
MNLIDQTFSRLKEQGQTALIPFLTIGDPDVETSVRIIAELEAAGADIVELGVPYSDPLADGPVIQRASQRALKHQVNIAACMDAAVQARAAGVKLPFILFTYYNPVLQFGLDRFFDEVKRHDISGLIIPDLPVEESAELIRQAEAAEIHVIPLVAPTSKERIKSIVADAKGFVYCVSSLGVTGERSSFYEGVEEFIGQVREYTDTPVAIGFGISSREQAERFSRICDGVVVGSAIVRTIEDTIPLLQNADTRQDGLLQIRKFVSQLKA